MFWEFILLILLAVLVIYTEFKAGRDLSFQHKTLKLKLSSQSSTVGDFISFKKQKKDLFTVQLILLGALDKDPHWILANCTPCKVNLSSDSTPFYLYVIN